MRICSFVPSATETIFALGLQDELYGVTHECDYPDEAKLKEKLTSSLVSDKSGTSSREIDNRVRTSLNTGDGIYSLNFEALREARPDIIFTQQLCEVCAVSYGEIVRAASRLDKKPDIVSLDTFSFEDILTAIKTIGERCGVNEEADKLLDSLSSRIERVTELTSSFEKRKLFFMEWIDPMMTSGHWMPELVRRAGGRDDLGRDKKNSVVINWGILRDYDPDLLMIAPCGFGVDRAITESRVLKEHDGWNSLSAVTKGLVFALDGNAYYSRPGPRIVDGLEILAGILHSEISAKLSPRKFGEMEFRRIQ